MIPASPAVDHPRRRWLSFAQREAGMVALVAAVAVLLLAFREISEAVGAGEARAFDLAIYEALRPRASAEHDLSVAWANIAANDFSAMGSVSVLAFIVVMVCGLFLCAGAPRPWCC